MRPRLLPAGLVAIAWLIPLGLGSVPPAFARGTLGALLAIGVVLAAAPPGWRVAVRRSATALVAAGLALGAAEVSLRTSHPYAGHDRPHDALVESWSRMPLVHRYRTDRRYEGPAHGDLAGFTGRPEHREPRTVVFRTDRHGFRNADVPSAIDVVVAGDSFGAGAETTQERTWPAVLADRHGWTVYNLSMPGSSPWHEYVNLAAEVDRLDLAPGARVVWLLFAGNDLDESLPRELELGSLPWRLPPRVFLAAWENFRRHSPVRRLLENARATFEADFADLVLERPLPGGRTALFFRPYVERSRRTAGDVRSHPNLEALESVLVAMRDVCARRDLSLELVLAPSKEEVYPWLVEEAAPDPPIPGGLSIVLAERAEALGVPFTDLAPAFAARARALWQDSGELLYWLDDTHWNESGHDLAASTIHEAVLGER